jgi:hypothetical protein
VTLRVAAALAAAVVGLSGCGGKSDAESPPPNDAKPSSNQNPDANLGAP